MSEKAQRRRFTAAYKLKVLQEADQTTKPGELDNYATHKHPTVRRWLARHPRVHFHFTPTSASWLNLVERFFNELTTRRFRRLAVSSVEELIAAITRYIDQRNQQPRS